MYDTGMPVEEDTMEESGDQTDNLDCSTATRNRANKLSLEHENTWYWFQFKIFDCTLECVIM